MTSARTASSMAAVGRLGAAGVALAAAVLARPAAGATAPGTARGNARSVKDTSHNLSRSGRNVGNTVVAEGVSEICVFCHTPHTGAPSAPIWNRDSSGVTYKLYASSTMRGVPRQPEGRSRFCLSCHDGTVAVGVVRRRPSGAAEMHGFESGGALMRLAGRPTNLGTDLSDDHPIMVDYDEAAGAGEEFAPRSTLPREFRLKDRSTVECTTCHNPHRDEFRPFLVADNTDSALCGTCHVLRDWRSSIHRTSRAEWNGRGRDPFHLPGQGARRTVADNACESCHRPHGAEQGEWLLKGVEEQLCFTCHNGNVARTDIESESLLPYGHHVARTQGVHDAYENLDPTGRTLDGPDNDNRARHVECADCHAPHAAGERKHQPGTNEVSDVLRGVSGVRLTYGSAPGEPPSYSWVPSYPGASYEYEICMKCHSSWMWEGLPPLTSDGTVETDAAIEFNPNNASYHAVVGESRASALGDYVAPWNSRSRLYCTDCHRGDGTGASGGAHGSRVRFLLAGSYDRTTGLPGSEQHLCFKCHRFATYADPRSASSASGTAFASKDGRNLHAVHAGKKRKDTKLTVVCRDCHTGRPHGMAENKALLVDDTLAPPYRDADAGLNSVDVWPVLPQAWEDTMGPNCSAPGCH
ncbi:MAG: cytochrome c3 family protein [Planctomycetota bacterium]